MNEIVDFDMEDQAKKVQSLKNQLLNLPQLTIETKHLVHGGMYARTIFIPAGSAVIGVKTNIDNICTVSGDVTVSTDKGPIRLTGYNVIPANSGFSRAGFAHSDTYWTTFFPTKLDDIQLIEDSITDDSHNLQTRKAWIRSCADKSIEE